MSFQSVLPDNTSPDSRFELPLAVVMERRIKKLGRWSAPQWELISVLPGQDIAPGGERVTLNEDETGSRYLWGGLKLSFYKDASEGYWYNLLSQSPYIFVICSGEEADEDLEPRFVTVNQDEATAHMESHDLVLSTPMSPELCEFLERYVVTYYQPQVKKKRKRRDWSEEAEHAQRPKY